MPLSLGEVQNATGTTRDRLGRPEMVVEAPVHSFLVAWGSNGSGYGQFTDPQGTAIDDVGRIYVVDRNNHRVQILTGN